jgi:AAA+ ATPase superfamily predicted ATPase
METPFIFGKIVNKHDFTNREKETQQLSANFTSNINTILISPRRWGKSSLVAKAAGLTAKKNKHIRCVMIDLYNIRSEEEFYQLLAQEVVKATATKTEDLFSIVKKFLSHFIPKVSYSGDDIGELSIGLDWKELKKNPDQLLNLAEKIAIDKKIKLVICIDEFQNISTFDEPLSFQKKVRAHWQKHHHVTYCLYGSKRHMLMEVFNSPSMPFYKFGDLIFLEKIKQADWTKYITLRFRETGKKIEPAEAMLISEITDCHPYYVQQLSQQCWLRSNKTCTKAIVLESHDSLMLQLSLLFQTITDGLSKTQVNILKAILNGQQQLSSKETIEEYKLGTSANVNRLKQTMQEKEIIDILNNKIVFLDPLYKSWLSKYYFHL